MPWLKKSDIINRPLCVTQLFRNGEQNYSVDSKPGSDAVKLTIRDSLFSTFP